MAWKRSILLVANVTATSEELLDALRARAGEQPTAFTLIVPATPFGGGRESARQQVLAAVDRLREAGLEVDGSIGHGDPIIAVMEAWDPKRFDEIMISTLPTALSKWLQADLPHRVAKVTGAPVTHVVSSPPKRDYTPVPPPVQEKQGVLRPLSVLGWGAGGGTDPAR
jgi:nucleotide-binding universal stress UspA family protein